MEHVTLEYLWMEDDLLHSILEGLIYYQTHTTQGTVQQDLLLSIQKVAESLNLQSTPETITLLETIKESQIEQLESEVNIWYTQVYETLFQQMLQCLPTLKGSSKQRFESFFEHLLEAPIKTPASSQLMLKGSLLAGAVLPKAAYHNLIKLMEQNPACLSGKDNVHPGYIYEPTPQTIFDCCPVCKGKGVPYYTSAPYYMQHYRSPFQPFKLWMKCPDCQNMYTYLFPKEILALSDSTQLLQPNPEAYSILPVNGLELSIWDDVLTKLRTYTTGNSLLEVGVGHGALLAVALETGYEVNAVEIMQESARTTADALQIPVWNGDFLNYPEEEKYSIIIMGDVIEHLTDPKRALTKAKNLLTKDGVLWLSTPNYESSFSRMRKFEDPMWNELLHITYFSKHGLIQLAKSCGLEIKEYKISNRYNGSMEIIFTPICVG